LQSGVEAMERLVAMPDGEREAMLDKAQAYVQERTWEKAADVLEEALRKAIDTE